jgi:hypothetical protein
VCFEDIILAIQEDRLLDIVEHPAKMKYPHQRMLVIEIEAYAHLVPFVEDEEKLFLKTIIPSRKATRDYLQRKNNDK